MKAKNRLEKQLTVRYIMRYLVKIAIYTVVLLAVFVLIFLLVNQVSWRSGSPFRAWWSNDMLLTVTAAAWAIGILIIALMDFRKIAAQFASVGSFLTKIAEQPETSIELPQDFLEMQTIFQKVQNDILAGRKTEQEAIQRKNDLVMYLAHDLKTPLTSILGYLALLRDEEDISPKNRGKYLTVIDEKAVRLENLINNFFEIARFNLSELILEKSRFDFSRLVEQVADEFKPLLTAKGLKIEVSTIDKAELFADSGKLERVIDNLIRNAIGYSYENSVISVKVTNDKDSLMLQVSNQGQQIPAHKIDHIFEQFYRVDESRPGNSGGAGLGLTIARAILERHGGGIAVESTTGHTTFTVTLPFPAIS
ncbi:MAG: HAMP domain-containing histidine kinase [Treponema sp.]|nr:HAMP domain-containing histidine kinase [Treponema sp.]